MAWPSSAPLLLPPSISPPALRSFPEEATVSTVRFCLLFPNHRHLLIAFPAVDLDAAECNTGKCLEVVAAAGCIIAGIAARSVGTVLACVGGATDKVRSRFYDALCETFTWSLRLTSVAGVWMCWLHQRARRLP